MSIEDADLSQPVQSVNNKLECAQQLALAQAQLLQSLVQIYQSLGGGWQE